MQNDVLVQKLDSVARCLERLTIKTPKNKESLEKDVDLQDIVMINLERLVQTCVDIAGIVISSHGLRPIPATMAESFDVLAKNGVITRELGDRLRKAVGFRNIAVHEYDKVNWDVVYSILTKHLNDFRKFARVIEKLASQ